VRLNFVFFTDSVSELYGQRMYLLSFVFESRCRSSESCCSVLPSSARQFHLRAECKSGKEYICYYAIRQDLVQSYDIVTYRGVDKSLARPERKQATATEDFDAHVAYL
jgi:hypothetical protein